jgi:hypothetical protein
MIWSTFATSGSFFAEKGVMTNRKVRAVNELRLEIAVSNESSVLDHYLADPQFYSQNS